MDLFQRIAENTRQLREAGNKYQRALSEMSDEELLERRDRLDRLIEEGLLLQAELKVEEAFGLININIKPE